MKVFIYKKDKTSSLLDVIKNVKRVIEENDRIYIYTSEAVIMYCTNYVKTRIYQN